MSFRFKRETGDVPPSVAAHYMGFDTVAPFEAALPALIDRGFPAPDPTTGKFDLDAIRVWRRSRNPHLFPADHLPASPAARDAKDVVRLRLTGSRGG